MTPDSSIKLVSELLDLPLYDNEGKYCGIVDDVELSGGPGKDLKLKAVLVGPGA
jgi:sporulation protein YlmC with PRC-barrel domain